MAPMEAAIRVDTLARHGISWHRPTLDAMRSHWRDYVDRRGTGVRGYSSWLNAVVWDGIVHQRLPEPDPRPVPSWRNWTDHRWNPEVHAALLNHWATTLRHVSDAHAVSHSQWVNDLVAQALADLAPVKAMQPSLPGIPAAAPRRARQFTGPQETPAPGYHDRIYG